MTFATSHDTSGIRLVIGWWTVTTWTLWAASFVAYIRLFESVTDFFLNGDKVEWLGVAVLGALGGVMALRNLKGWRLTLWVAYALGIALLVIYWIELTHKILIHEDTKTLFQVSYRVWQMVTISFSTTPSGWWWMVGGLSTFYRELLMLLLQIAAVTVLALWSMTHSTPSNPTIERDAPRAGRPSL